MSVLGWGTYPFEDFSPASECFNSGSDPVNPSILVQ